MPSGSEVAAAAAVKATEAVENVAARPGNELSPTAVIRASREIEAAVETAIKNTPEVQHVLNTEPWYTKRSRWAFIIGLVVGLGKPALAAAGVPVDEATTGFVIDAVTQLGILWASYLALRAGMAKTPLGSKPTK